jgi:hypothetical protein
MTSRLYCRCSRILHKISSYYAPLQAAIENFNLNCIFSSTIIYCKKRISTEKRECLFSIRKLFVSFHTKWDISRRKVQGVNIYQNANFFYIRSRTNFYDPSPNHIARFQNHHSTLLYTPLFFRRRATC